MYENFLSTVELLKEIDSYEREQMAEMCDMLMFNNNITHHFYGHFHANEITQYNSNSHSISEGVLAGPTVSDFFLEHASYIRLDNLSLSYQLPATKLFKSASISLTGENLFTITDYSGLDPEINLNLAVPGIESIRPINGNRNEGAVYFRAKTFTLGLNVNF